MAERPSDLSWDYNETPDLENTPLLEKMHSARRRKPSRVEGDVILNREQVELLLQCFKDSAALLRNNLGPDGGSMGSVSLHTQAEHRPKPTPLMSALTTCANWMVLWTLLIQAGSVLLNSLIDYKLGDPVDAYKSIVVVSVCASCGNCIMWLSIFGKIAKDVYLGSYSLWQALTVYVSGMLVFAGLYTATLYVQKSSWKFTDHITEHENYATYYGQFLFYSINIATLHGCQNLYPTLWYTKLVATTQMLLSMCQLFLTLILSLHRLRHVRDRPARRDLEPSSDVYSGLVPCQDRSYFYEGSAGGLGSPGFRASTNLYGSCGMMYQNYSPSNSNPASIASSVPNVNITDK